VPTPASWDRIVTKAEDRCDWPDFTFAAMPVHILAACRNLSLSLTFLVAFPADESAAQQPSIGGCWTTGGGGAGAALAVAVGICAASAAAVGGGVVTAAPEGTGTACGSGSFLLQAASKSPEHTKRTNARAG